jgi:sodium-coupled neutral amino acid transporter 11
MKLPSLTSSPLKHLNHLNHLKQAAYTPATTTTIPTIPHGGEEAGTSTVPSSIFNLVNNVAGAGILTLSSGMARGTGWVPAISTCLVLGAISSHTFCLIGKSCELTNSRDFKSLWSKTISPNSTPVVDLIITLMCSAASVIYSGILGDITKELLANFNIDSTRTNNILFVTAGILLPLSLLKNLSALAFTSILGFASIMYTVAFIVFRYLDTSYSVPLAGKFLADVAAPAFTKTSLWNIDFTSLTLMSNLGLAYIAHYNAPVYYRELKEKKSFNKMVRSSFGILTALYATAMGFGYATFGDISAGNILLNYSSRDILSTLGRYATLFSILFGFPLAFCGIREGVLSIGSTFNTKLPFVPTVVALLSIITAISITVKDISTVVGITGAAMGSTIVYILPAYMYYKSVGLKYGQGSKEVKSARGNLALIPFGVFLAVFGVAITLGWEPKGV